ncbi:hypothetical protein IWW38_006563, partial [Coemansia aciculifera]
MAAAPIVSATPSAESVKALSVRERLALWRKSKEQTSQTAVAAETDSRPTSRASSMADDGNQFVTAPSSAASDMNTGSDGAFESLPASPGLIAQPSALSVSAPKLQSGSSVAIAGRTLGAVGMKTKLGINNKRPLLKPSLLSKSVFGADDGSADTDNSGGGASLQRPKRPPIDFSALSDSASAGVVADSPMSVKGSAMDVDVVETDPLEDYMHGVGALVDGSHSMDADLPESSTGDALPHARASSE